MPDTNNDLILFLRTLLEIDFPLPDDVWLPAAQQAVSEPAAWVAVFSELEASAQQRLLAVFSGEGANIYSDIMLLLLVEQRAADGDTLAMLANLARRLADRQRDRLALLDARLARLGGVFAGDLQGRLREYAARNFELRAEIEKRIRERPDLWELLNAEMEYGRLQWELAGRSEDLKGRAARRDETVQAIRAVEQQIEAFKKENVKVVRRLEELKQALAPLEAQAGRLRQELDAAEARNDSLRREADAARDRLKALEEERDRLKTEAENDTREARLLEIARQQEAEAAATIRRQLDAARNALDELALAPEIKQQAELEKRLVELMQALPADDASRRF